MIGGSAGLSAASSAGVTSGEPRCSRASNHDRSSRSPDPPPEDDPLDELDRQLEELERQLDEELELGFEELEPQLSLLPPKDPPVCCAAAEALTASTATSAIQRTVVRRVVTAIVLPL
ncbi:MAG TPA: hypothetical protein VIL20_18250 [Sandaracinaceae bacterium]